MAVDIKVPSVGESITEGTLSRWFKTDGDPVKTDEPLFELETEKATTEVAAPATGTLRITVKEGQTIPIGSAVGRIEPGTPVEASTSQKQQVASKSAPLQGETPTSKQKTTSAPEIVPHQRESTVILSPSARRVAEESGVDVQSLTGTGRGGRITKEDVLTHLEKEKAPPAEKGPKDSKSLLPETKGDGKSNLVASPSSGSRQNELVTPEGRETRRRMSAIRQRIADRLLAAKNNAAILTTFNETDLSSVMTLRSRYKDSFKERHGVNLGFMSFFVKACVDALRAYPIVNSRIDGTDIVFHHFYDIGVAVSTEKGLMVPVVRDADHLSFAQIEAYIGTMAQKAREGKISVGDLQGGTFTITNGGVFGSLLSTPILNAPQSAILGMHTIQKRPMVVNDEVVIRPMMYLALSYDHRLIDGKEAVQFLVRVKECIENPERLLLEI